MAENKELRIVSAVADKKQAILYLEDGSTIVLKQGDHRLGDLLDVVIPITTRGEIAVVSLNDFSVYAAFEQKSQGLTKFFKMAKSKVSGWFGGKQDTHETHIPEEGKMAILRAVRGETMTEEMVKEHGQPIDMTDEVKEDEVVVAVVTTPAIPATETAPAVPETKKVIPGVNAIKPLIDHAVKTNSVGVQAFLARCAQFIDNRQHSVDDLMRFLERGDLPLADDGSIIAYKMLRRKNGSEDIFVDCHSGNIPQRVGSYVCVNEALVDLNRRNECSNGLHIARRGYLSGFGGDVCVLCKIDPEDVMVVPHNDPNKVRVKGYHILGVMSDEAMKLLKQNKPMTGEEAALSMVYNAIKGNHIDRIERVQVNGQMGNDVVITRLKHDKTKNQKDFNHSGSDLAKAAALDDEVNTVGTVDPRDINKRVNEAHKEQAAKKAAEAPKQSELANLLLDYHTAPEGNAKIEAARALVAFKKAKKKGWSSLNIIVSGISDEIEKTAAEKTDQELHDEGVMASTPGSATAAETAKAVKPKAGTKEKKAASIPGNPLKKSDPNKHLKATAEAGKRLTEAKKVKAPVPEAKPAETRTKAEKARHLFATKQLDKLRAFKKQSKKGWSALGFNDAEIKVIETKK